MKTAVFFMEMPDTIGKIPLKNALRKAEIDSAKNECVACERYWSFALLDAGADLLGIAESASAKRSESGKWGGLPYEFSISHSGNAVAVAVSEKAIGVDLQTDTGIRLSDALLKRALNERETATLSALTADEARKEFLRIWSAKESLFKRENKAVFHPKEYDSSMNAVKTLPLSDGWLTVASEDGEIDLYQAFTDGETIKTVKNERSFSI